MAYDLKSMNAPRLAGRALTTFVAALETGPTRALLLPKLLADAGITGFRERTFAEPPSVRPYIHRPAYPIHAEPGVPAASLLGTPRGPGFQFETIADFQEAYRSGRLTPETVAKRFIEANCKLEANNPPLRAITQSNADDLLAMARESTERWKAGRPLGPLDGVPVSIKEELDVVGYRSTTGTKFRTRVATEDATIVGRLRAAGALLVGKANMHEIGIDTSGYNQHHGTPRNPYGPGHYTGGSSSGSGASVASGLTPVSIGADGGGSIRIPAAHCGVVGLKSTWSRVSEHGAAPLCPSVGHCGPLGATAADVAIAWAAIAGPDVADRFTVDQPPPVLPDLRHDKIEGVRLGVYRPWFEHAAPDVVKACDEMLKKLVARGAVLVDIELPDLDLVRLAHAITILSEMWTFVREEDKTHRKDWSPGVRVNLAIARELKADDYVRAQQVRTRATTHVERALERCDAIVTPTSAVTAPAIRPDVLPFGESDLHTTTETMRFVVLANLTGHPAISFPAGYDAAGLPVGLQAIGRAWEEGLLLKLAHVGGLSLERQAPKLHERLLG